MINIKLDELFDIWKEQPLHKYRSTSFVKDGIIDIEKWKFARKKVLFFLKEAYLTGIEDQDLRIWLNNEVEWNIWRRTAELAFMLQNTTANDTPCLEHARANIKSALLSSAVINIKKSDGKKPSTYDDLQKYAKEDSQLLRRQIEIINPDIIIMGNIKGLVNDYIFNLGEPLNDDGRLFNYNNMLFVDYWHPAYPIPAPMYYYTLAAMYTRYLKIGVDSI